MGCFLKLSQYRSRKINENKYHLYIGRINDSEMPLPNIGKEYNAYDDGKITPSREYKVRVLNILKYRQLPRDIRKKWKELVKLEYWLYSPSSDYFVEALNLKTGEKQYFARTFGNGWFGLEGIYCGNLDVDGSLEKQAYVEYEVH